MFLVVLVIWNMVRNLEVREKVFLVLRKMIVFTDIVLLERCDSFFRFIDLELFIKLN